MTADISPDLTGYLTDSRRKKLLFRGWHRGTREADLLVGRFAEQYLKTCDEADLDAFERLLEEGDPDIFDWVSGKEPLPDKAFTPVLRGMISFYRDKR